MKFFIPFELEADEKLRCDGIGCNKYFTNGTVMTMVQDSNNDSTIALCPICYDKEEN